MPIPATGQFSMETIRTEFGGTIPDAINEYYRGGGRVPAGALATIPTSGMISFGDFKGSGATIDPPVAVGASLLTQSFTGTPATAYGLVYDQSFTFNPIARNAGYQINWSMTSTATYDFTYGNIIIDWNGTNIYTGQLGAGTTLPDWQDSWFRDFSGVRNVTGPNIFTLGFGGTVRVRMTVATRLQRSSSLLHTAFSFNLTRVS